jgi:hypothetical protein
MSPLQSIPARTRTLLYWIGYVLGVISQATTIVWGAVAAASPDVSMPLWLVIVSAVVGFAQTQLNLLAGSNVTDPNTVTTQAPPASTVSTDVHLTADPAHFTEAMRRASDYGDGDPHRAH